MFVAIRNTENKMYKGALLILCILLSWSIWSYSSGVRFDQKPRVRALLATDYSSLEDFKAAVDIVYLGDSQDSFLGTVKLCYEDNDELLISALTDGVTQGDLTDAHKGSIWDKLALAFRTPYAVWNRKDLSKIYMLARVRKVLFGEGDVAFYDLAEASMRNIIPINGAFDNFRDSLEKGYINTFNHITAQSVITALYDDEIADYLAVVHERHAMPQLVSGLFSEEQLHDTLNFPVDNYVDIINNEIGQKLGNYLKSKYKISNVTVWTAGFTCQFLNEVQEYYSSSFEVDIIPFKEDDNVIVRFSSKIETIKKTKSYL